jgi:hypothetical protein
MAYEMKIARFLVAISAVSLAAASACSSDDSAGGGTGGGAGNDAGGGTAGEGASGGGSPDGGECASGCTCDREESCDYTCAAECTVECLGGTCTAACPEGSCTLDADFRANANYTCSGGSCVTDCDGASDCTVDCSGGGCEVACDGNSTCTVSCSETGDPCAVTCVAGSTATCTGNCDVQGCEVCDPTPDPTYQPTINPAQFTNVIDNPLFPLPVGAIWVYNAPGEVITVTVTNETKTVMGVDVVVVHDEVRSAPGDDLIEDTRDWYAQDNDGNVWYFGEDTAEYVSGQVATTAGSWEAGVGGALPGIIMQADPTVGQVYKQEYLVCEAEDMGEVIALGESATVPTGSYSGCVRTRDFSPLDPAANEYKTYCPGVGLVLVKDVVTGDTLETLNSVTLP